MSVTTLPIPQNPHAAALEAAIAESARPIECLVVAHNDPKMLSDLTAALDGEAAVVLEASQDVWDFDGEHLPTAIAWAVEQTGLHQVVLVGHTLAGGRQSRASLAAAASRDSYQTLLSGVQQSNTRILAAQERFALQVQQLLQVPQVANRCSSRELSVHGLLYRAESGVFLAYDAGRDTFRPLLG
ncbi:Carbonic anhydrase [Posidoniimonas polymericola]|uniref:Carbonic anhydrase n=1 Tax=Posidoniimonas polymericola TaxID=2528002 RepID=A0A5C5YTS0_9BACT|nr:carbonic anhydrase [Posidoniimonas polymericola]TWT78358.1 Carbonic anhydrase [Posidoniimonas polymericola]